MGDPVRRYTHNANRIQQVPWLSLPFNYGSVPRALIPVVSDTDRQTSMKRAEANVALNLDAGSDHKRK